MARIIKATELANRREPRLVVLKLRELTVEARDVILDARKQAARILADANARAQSLQLKGEEAGHAEGFARGRQEGAAEGERKAYQDACDRLNGLSDQVAAQARAILDQLARQVGSRRSGDERQMIRFAVELARRIVGRVAVADIRAAEANLAKALELAGSRETVTVRVNPAQLERLQEHLAGFLSVLTASGKVRLLPDAEVSPGGAKAETQYGQIDATIETQLANAVEALLAPAGEVGGVEQYQPEGQYEQV